MIKNINFSRFVKVLVPSQNAILGSSLSPVLGQFGLSISQFCKDFNACSDNFEFDSLLNVTLIVMKNKTFSFEINSLPVSFLVFKIVDTSNFDKNEIIFFSKNDRKNKEKEFKFIEKYYFFERKSLWKVETK